MKASKVLVNSHKEIFSLQVLRGIAAIAVAAAHVNRINELYAYKTLGFSFPKFGDWGIDLFFVLSGFIIYYIHRSDFGKPKRLRKYLLKRFIRVYPLYWISTLMVLPVFFIFTNIGSGYERDLDVIIKSFLLYPQTHSPILMLGWTLVHEVRFYILFGVLIFLSKKRRIALATFLITLTLFFSITRPEGYSYLITDYLFSPFNLEFLFGCISASIVMSSLNFQRKILLLVTIFYITSLKFGVVLGDERIITLGIPFAFLISLLGIYELKNKIGIPKFLLFLGTASYSIYLTHYFIISVLVRFLLSKGMAESPNLHLIMLFVLILSIIGGCLFYLLVEKPLLKYLRKKLI